MRFHCLSTILFIAVSTMPAIVSACEGECITGSTDKFCSKYVGPKGVVTEIVRELDCHLQQCHHSNSPMQSRAPAPNCSSIKYLNPILKHVKEECFARVRQDVFPGFFHGKCLDEDGNKPDGCPNPDCPVVCGTPGSMVHFLESDLIRILYNSLGDLLKTSVEPGSQSYKNSFASYQKESKAFRFKRTPALLPGLGLLPSSSSKPSSPPVSPNDASSFRSGSRYETCDFTELLGELPDILLNRCGGPSHEDCTWKAELSKFILQYP